MTQIECWLDGYVVLIGGSSYFERLQQIERADPGTFEGLSEFERAGSDATWTYQHNDAYYALVELRDDIAISVLAPSEEQLVPATERIWQAVVS